jgi:multiple sugar transport system ATP-binding protein
MATLELKNIKKVFGGKVTAVNHLNLEVKEGEFMVFLGPSGCGKTTTMRMVAGLEDVTEGQVILDGEDITYKPTRKRGISMIFQQYAVWPHMTVFDNIAYALKLKKMDKEVIKEKVENAARLTHIDQLLDRYPSQLSGGQQQRVAVARAIAVEPKLFLMDEPLSNLDAKLRVSTRTELKSIHKQTGATTIFVTHDQAEAMSMADRIMIMKDGEVMQIGTPDEVYHQSANLFVAGFIGTPPTNFLNVDVVDDGKSLELKNDYVHMTADAEQAALIRKSGLKKVIMGVRPENFVLVDNAKDAIFSEPCLLSEPQGSHQIATVDLGGLMVKIVAEPVPHLKSGEMLHVGIVADKVSFFNPESENRLTM